MRRLWPYKPPAWGCGPASLLRSLFPPAPGTGELRHRGQRDGVFASHKDLGLVGEVFSGEILDRFPQGTMAVGHTRYGTTGASNRSNCQPIEVNHQKGRMALAHNGNLSNAVWLRDKLELSGAIFTVPATPRSSPISSPKSGLPPPPLRTPSVPPWVSWRGPTLWCSCPLRS